VPVPPSLLVVWAAATERCSARSTPHPRIKTVRQAPIKWVIDKMNLLEPRMEIEVVVPILLSKLGYAISMRFNEPLATRREI
jgi:hypothetical protein